MTSFGNSAMPIQPLQMVKKSHSGKIAPAKSGACAGPGRGLFISKSLPAMQLGLFETFGNLLALRLLHDSQPSFPMRL